MTERIAGVMHYKESMRTAIAAMVSVIAIAAMSISVRAQDPGASRINPGEIERRIQQLRPTAPVRPAHKIAFRR